MNLYELLEVSKDCSSDELRRQYHRLLLRFHPDKNDSTTRNEFERIQNAYRILSDVELRLKYDQEEQRRQLHQLAHTQIDFEHENEFLCRCGTLFELDDDFPSNHFECPNCSMRIEIRRKE